MKTLIIPDIHNKIGRADLVIKAHYDEVDKVIFLGDFFDDYGDSVEDASKTASWVRAKMEDPKFNFIWGNHDISYGYHWSPFVRCSGYEMEKKDAIIKIMTRDCWDKFVPYIWEQDYLLSHAGASWNFLKTLNSSFKFSTITVEEIAQELEISWSIDQHRNLPQGSKPILFNAGWDRGGYDPAGGLNWGCWTTFNCVPGLKQIVGHTVVKKPLVKFIDEIITHNLYVGDAGLAVYPEDVKGWALNIDTNLHNYVILENGRVKIHNIND